MIRTITNEDNGLHIEKADSDGIHLIESAPFVKEKNKVYIYYSEIDQTIQKLRKAKFDWSKENEFGEHSLGSVKKSPNAISQYKDFGNVDTFKEYQNYIRSDEWQQKRKQRLALDNHRCKNCGGKQGLEVHHKRYDGFLNESVVNDLITLCEDCHNRVTLVSRKKRKVVLDVS